MRPAEQPRWVGTCECGKRIYATRKDAKRAARVAHPNGHLSAYRCPKSGEFHIGHLPTPVRTGDRSRDDVREFRDRFTSPRQGKPS